MITESLERLSSDDTQASLTMTCTQCESLKMSACTLDVEINLWLGYSTSRRHFKFAKSAYYNSYHSSR